MENKRYNKKDFLLLIGFFLILISLIIFLSYYVIYNINSCTRDPLKYAVERIKKNTNADFITGSISINKYNGGGYIVFFGERNESQSELPMLNISIGD